MAVVVTLKDRHGNVLPSDTKPTPGTPPPATSRKVGTPRLRDKNDAR